MSNAEKFPIEDTLTARRIDIIDVIEGFKRIHDGLAQVTESVRIAAQSLAMVAPEAADGAQRGE